MLDISFSAPEDNSEFVKSAGEYRSLWKDEGEKITGTLEELSGLRFISRNIDATISDRSFSHPLTLKGGGIINWERRLVLLIHELIHILFTDNEVKLPMEEEHRLELHKKIYLFQYEVVSTLYGKDVAQRNARDDTRNHPKLHGEAWNWALSLSDKERKLYLDKYLRYS